MWIAEEMKMNAVRIVEDFWAAVWKARNPDAVADFVVEDFVLVTGGLEIKTRENFIAWVRDFLGKINDFHFEVLETFQNESGTRVASLWQVRGKNNGILGTPPDRKPFVFTGTAVWDVRSDGKLLRNRVERAAWEAHQQLIRK
jgi:steroid delta-isomerase-like uncharacterized protein